MNMLNNLILEGVVSKELCDNEFTITVTRCYKNAEGSMVEEKSDFDVEICGKMLADVITHNICLDRGVRVVGRLKQKKWKDEEGKEHSKVVIIAEHIEFKLRRKIPCETD